MSTNDGKKLLVFGLGFAQQDNRMMQQVLRHYDRLPRNPGSRASLFLELNNLAKELMTDEAAQDQIHQITQWMKNGGDFPLGIAPDPLNAHAIDRDQDDNSSEVFTNDENYDDTFLTDYRLHRRGIEQYGQGRTINDPPEAVTAGEGHEDDVDDVTNQSGNVEMRDVNDDNQWGTMAERNYYFYGRGRTLNDPPEPANMNEFDDTSEGEHDQHHANEDVPMNDPVNDTDFENGNEGVIEGGLEQDEVQLQVAASELSGAANGPSHGSSMNPDEANDAEMLECPICLEDYPPSGFPKRRTITAFCDHPDKACLQCLDSSITVMIERGALHLLACPICPQKLSHKDMKEYANKKVYERYIYLKQQSEIPGHWISCTNTECGGSQPHESEDPKMICNHCTSATCAKHKRPWHEGQTCGEFDMDDAQIERLEEEEATAKLLAKESTSICPKCGQGVTKTDGCDHMRCQCGQEWCYICSCAWENILRIGETAHATFCIYHPNKVNLTKAQQDASRRRIMGLVHGGEISAELAKARDELRQRRRVEIRAKALEAAEARMKGAMEQKRSTTPQPEHKKKKVKLVAPWEEGGRTKKAL
ncbi:hypothetical protein VMCG_05382 [Cytospora schulzeri]|uniref:RBR-type E3 ubiquitin transferase n=1 Tax=Cytospora schulzeri TaxID=448051 RepID=A0A423WK57_9PEZI|nr:hypothetical protein VMCG_05382 [Valsa malicola]